MDERHRETHTLTHMTWGTFADWVTAATTLGALIAAVWAAITARNLYRVESARDRIAAEQARRMQAEGVAAWCATKVGSDRKPESYGIVVHNASSSVIYDVVIGARFKSGLQDGPRLTMLPPGAYYIESTPGDRYPWAFAVEVSAIPNEIQPVTKSADMAIEKLAFRDSADRTWARERSGTLQIEVS